MPNVNDKKLESLQTSLSVTGGHIDDHEIAWLQSHGATSDQINEAWREVMQLNGATSPNVNDAAKEFLDTIGTPYGHITDSWWWFWTQIGDIPGGGGPWEYASLAIAEAAWTGNGGSDNWQDGDDVQITGGTLFIYLTAYATNGHSGLLPKYPWDGTGTLGTLTGGTNRDSQGADTDPDTWWTDNGTGTNGVDYSYDNPTRSRLRKLTTAGRAMRLNDNTYSADTAQVVIIRTIKVTHNSLATGSFVYSIVYRDGVNVERVIIQATTAANWIMNHGSGATATTIPRATSEDIIIFCKQGRWAVWHMNDDSNSTPNVSGTVPSVTTETAYSSLVSSGSPGASGTVDVELKNFLIGGVDIS